MKNVNFSCKHVPYNKTIMGRGFPRFHKPSFAIVYEECEKWEALSNYVGENGTVGDMIIMISAIQRAFKYSNDKGGIISEDFFTFELFIPFLFSVGFGRRS